MRRRVPLLAAAAFFALASPSPAQPARDMQACSALSRSPDVSALELYSTCAQAARSAHHLAHAARTVRERQEYASGEALYAMYAAGGAHQVGADERARALLLNAHTIWADLARDGYSGKLKAQSQRALQCFFERDRRACGTLFPEGREGGGLS